MPKISAKITMFSNYRPKEFLKSVASSFGCSVTIDDQESFGVGFLSLTKMTTVWFTISGPRAKECYSHIEARFNNMVNTLLNNIGQ